MLQIVIQGAHVTIEQMPQGIKLLNATDPTSQITVSIPLDPASARAIGLQLTTSIQLATNSLPKEPPHANIHNS